MPINTMPVEEFEELEADKEEVAAKADPVLAFYRLTAQRIWPRGCVMRCPKCDRHESATVGQIANYLAQGWPVCCRTRMHVGDAATN